ncbi:uncharacterized protein LOC141903687 isoform X1 [Tubulanus polymorphus]|uniref:uncharacterized protein LOC141903687 isoform X1 n=1 Tax=Tubulanus polymorphus TaxID=672921 RepID=UPI003DA3A69F
MTLIRSLQFVVRTQPVLVRYTCRSSYHGGGGASVNSGAGENVVIDLRSDTVTQPNAAMRLAMQNATVGDDVFGEDPTVNSLQDRCAKLFGKEAALFIPTGTMGNLIALMVYCDGRGLECLLGDKSHIFLYEQGGMAQIAGVHPRTVSNLKDGTFDLTELEYKIRISDDVHQPVTRMICVENTHNVCGGRIMPIDFLKHLYQIAKKNEINMHMDGARLMNAAVALDIPVSDITRFTDTVTMCFSKGLGAPIGSILSGSADFIQGANRLRKCLGGGMRQAGVLAAAAHVALDEAQSKLKTDHHHARQLAEALNHHGKGIVSVDLNGIETNIVMINMETDDISAEDLCERFAQVSNDELKQQTPPAVVKMRPTRFSPRVIRLVLHRDINPDYFAMLLEKLPYVFADVLHRGHTRYSVATDLENHETQGKNLGRILNSCL